MKTSINLALLLVITTLFSCSSSSDTTVPSTANTLTLPKKITEVSYRSGSANTYVNDFLFENNVLISTTYATDRRYDFVYNGDKIVEMKKYVAGVASGSNVFNYVGDKLNYVLSTSEGSKTEYTYTGNVLSRVTYKTVNGTTETIDQTKDITFNTANNISQEIFTSYFSGSAYISKNNFTYDSKNTPTTNFNKYLKLLINGEATNGLNTNNPITKNYYNPSTNPTPTEQSTYQITYNSNQYPTQIKQYKVSDGSLVSDTTIEYY